MGLDNCIEVVYNIFIMKHKSILMIFDSQYKRFWEKVNKEGPNDCWEWIGAINGKGYGIFSIFNTIFLAHRVSYYIVHGPISDGTLILHKCDNVKCVNPDHLYSGTQADNIHDRAERNPHNQGGQVSQFSKCDAENMKSLHKSGYIIKDIAEDYNVCAMTVHKILTGKTTNFRS